MAQLKDLIVNSVIRCIGKIYASEFVGKLTGNADTATKATQDSAGQQINTTYIKGLSVSGKTVTYTKGDGTTGTITTQDTNTTYSNATTSATGLMSASDKSKLDGITNSADAVSFSQSLTSGTKVGTITINGTGTDLYCQTNTDTHYTSHLYVGASGGNANATSATSNPYLLCVDNTTNRNSIQLKAGSNMSISATNGVVTFTSTDTNTHYASKNVVGSSTATSNTTSALTNGNVYLNSVENGAITSSHKISGSGATTVTTDTSGNIVISSTDNNTDTKVQTVTTNPTSATTYYIPFATGATTGTLAINDGLKVNSLQGTANAEGYDRISLGNNTATGTAGNKSSGLQMYGTTAYYTLFRPYNQSSSVTKYLVGTSSAAAVGSSTKPVYVSSEGTVTACTYTLEKSVPSDAVFTDTVYTHPTTAGNKHIPSGGSSGQILGYSADGTAVWTNSVSNLVVNGSLSVNRKADTDIGTRSIAIGQDASATEMGAIAIGRDSSATGLDAIAIGRDTTATGGFCIGSHSETHGSYSFAAGNYTIANQSQFSIGHYNSASSSSNSYGTTGTAFYVGNGTSSDSTSNACRITYAGAVIGKAAYQSTGADFAELREWSDGNPNAEDRRGYFVTMDGMNIRIASPGDYICGIISANPSVIGNNDEDWMGRYIFDDFGAFIFEDYEETDPETGEVHTYKKYKENPEYDPTREYEFRADRPEWDYVGLCGVIHVRDDGTCQQNGFCKCSAGGIATASERGYRVLERVNDHIVKVLFYLTGETF